MVREMKNKLTLRNTKRGTVSQGVLSKDTITRIKMRLSSVSYFLNKNMYVIAGLFVFVALGTIGLAAEPASAASSATANSLWNTLTVTTQTWVTRLGGVVMFVGGIMFGLGWKNDDAEQKSRGISTIISGAIVVAVAAMAGQFFGGGTGTGTGTGTGNN